MTIWVDASGTVKQMDASDPEVPVAIEDCTALQLSDDQAAAFLAAQETGGVQFDGQAFNAVPVAAEAVTPDVVAVPSLEAQLLTALQGASDFAGFRDALVKTLGAGH